MISSELGGRMVSLHDLPVSRMDKRTWINGYDLWQMLADASHNAEVWIESVHGMPQWGVASSFQFGCGFGSILSIVQVWRMPLQFVRSAQWKKDLQLAGKDKGAALDKARLLFPTAELHLKKHDGRAEALLIAHWAYLKYHRKTE